MYDDGYNDSTAGGLDPEHPEESLKAAFAIANQITNPSQLKACISAAHSLPLRSLVHEFCAKLPEMAKESRDLAVETGTLPPGTSVAFVESQLCVMLLSSGVTGLIIALEMEMQAHGLGIFRSKDSTVGNPPPVPDLSNMNDLEINKMLGLAHPDSEDKITREELARAMREAKEELERTLGESLDIVIPGLSKLIDEIEEEADGGEEG